MLSGDGRSEPVARGGGSGEGHTVTLELRGAALQSAVLSKEGRPT